MAASGVGALSFQKVEGLVAIPLSDVIFNDALVDGDLVQTFSLPGGKTALYKDPQGIPVFITGAFVIFDNDVEVKEI